MSSSRIDYQFNNAGDSGTWKVRVNNPDGQQSSLTSFTVTANAPAGSTVKIKLDENLPQHFPVALRALL